MKGAPKKGDPKKPYDFLVVKSSPIPYDPKSPYVSLQ